MLNHSGDPAVVVGVVVVLTRLILCCWDPAAVSAYVGVVVAAVAVAGGVAVARPHCWLCCLSSRRCCFRTLLEVKK